MELFCSYHFTADRDLETALRGDEPEIAARISQSIERGVRVLEGWALRSGGRMVAEAGTSGQLQIPADYLSELQDIVEQVEGATDSQMSVGVGAEPSEAETALVVAMYRSGIVLFTPEVADEAQDIQAEENEPQAEEMPEMAKGGFDEPKAGGEATQIAQGQMSPSAAMPSVQSPVSASLQSPPSAQEAPPADPGAPQNDQQLTQAIGEVLVDFKRQLPAFEQMKQSNPQAYEAVMGLVQAMLAMADQVTGHGVQAQGGAPAQEPAQKSESVEKVEGDRRNKARRANDRVTIDLSVPGSTSAPLAYDPKLPPGAYWGAYSSGAGNCPNCASPAYEIVFAHDRNERAPVLEQFGKRCARCKTQRRPPAASERTVEVPSTSVPSDDRRLLRQG